MQNSTLINYDCQGFSEQLPKGKASGTLRIEPSAVHVTIQEHRLRLPLEGLQISLGGANHRLVFLEHPLLKGWSVYTSDRRILREPYLRALPSVAALLAKARNKRLFGWGLLAMIATLLVAIPLVLIMRMDLLTGPVAKKIPPQWEAQLGDTALAQYQFGKTMLPDKEAEALLKPLVDPLLQALNTKRYQYHFHIVNDGSLNAFALPGGQVIIHSALILRADSAEELLGVLAHEINHVEQQHGLRNIIGATGIYIIAGAIFGDTSGLLAVIGGAAPLLLNQRYSRRFETQADVKGFALLQEANINPKGLASFFEKMIEEEKREFDKITNEDQRELAKKALAFLSTHPASEERIKKLDSLAEKTKPATEYRDLQADFVALQTAVKQFVTANKGDASNEN